MTGKVGAGVARHYKPSDLLKNPPRPEDITLELLLASQTHLGHRTSLWNPANARYIFGTWGQAHDAIHVISLDVTAAHLRRACKVVSGVAAKGGVILFVGTRDGQALTVVRAASLAGGCHLFDKWTPGTLTNAQQILGKCAQKVVNQHDEEVPGFESQLLQRAVIKPDLVVCLNPLENYVLLHECGMHNIPTIGIVDTDVNPTWVTYPIPANDDSLRSVSVIAGALGKAGQAGRELRLKRARAGTIDFEPSQGLRAPSREEIQASKRLKDSLSVEDRDDEEEEYALTPEEEELFAIEEAPAKQSVAEQEEEQFDDDLQIPANDDEALISLSDFSEDKSAAPELSEEEMDLLAESVQQSATQSVQENNAGDAVSREETTGHVADAPEQTNMPREATSNSVGDREYNDEISSTKPTLELTEEEEAALLAESVQQPSNEEIAARFKQYDDAVAQELAKQDAAAAAAGEGSSDTNNKSTSVKAEQDNSDKKPSKT